MRLTRHAEIRGRQRGFSDLSLDIIQRYGRSERVPGGATRLFFGEREYQRAIEELKRTMQLMDKAKGGSIVMKDGYVLTAYK